jgi:putative phage integrase
MLKVPISEAAEILGITKEAVYNRIRRGTLKYIQNGATKYVIINNESTKEQKVAQIEEFNATQFLLKQIDELKLQNQNLLKDKEQLYKEKEKILLDNKDEIAKIYSDRDEKLRYFLDMLRRPLIARANGEYMAPIDVEFVENLPKKWVRMDDFLTGLTMDKNKLKKLQNKILKNFGKSKFIKYENGTILVKSKKIIKKIIGDKNA